MQSRACRSSDASRECAYHQGCSQGASTQGQAGQEQGLVPGRAARVTGWAAAGWLAHARVHMNAGWAVQKDKRGTVSTCLLPSGAQVGVTDGSARRQRPEAPSTQQTKSVLPASLRARLRPQPWTAYTTGGVHMHATTVPASTGPEAVRRFGGQHGVSRNTACMSTSQREPARAHAAPQ